MALCGLQIKARCRMMYIVTVLRQMLHGVWGSHMLNQFRESRGRLKEAYRAVSLAEKIAFCAIVAFALGTLVYCVTIGDVTNIVLCLLVIVAMLAPRFLEWLFMVRFSVFFKVFVMCYIACGAILGSVFEFYYLFKNWDTLLHVICGFLMALVGFVALDVLNHHAASHISLASRVLFALTFALAAAVVWEFYEYAVDTFLNFDMQCDTVVHSIKSYLVGDSPLVVDTIDNITEVTINGVDLGLGGYLDLGHIDTMNDMLSNTAGGVLFCVLALTVRKPGSWFSRLFVPAFVWKESTSKEEQN